MDNHTDLTIREQMASGRWFEAANPELEADRAHANAVMMRFNSDTDLDENGRTALLRELFGSLGEGSAVAPSARVDYGYHVFIGKNCFFNFNCVFLDGAPIRFGDEVWVGPNVSFVTPLHPLIASERKTHYDKGGNAHLYERNQGIMVGKGVWIASGVAVNPGVIIGEGAVVASGSVVTRDIPPFVLAAGVPCKPLREITEADSIYNNPFSAG